LLQAGGDHPNAACGAFVVGKMLPVVEALLAQLQPH
jgi:hypothetical protein